jgi:hypothetical protein
MQWRGTDLPAEKQGRSRELRQNLFGIYVVKNPKNPLRKTTLFTGQENCPL